MPEDLLVNQRDGKLLSKIFERMPHGLVLHGPDGVGVSTIARSLGIQAGADVYTVTPKRKEKSVFVEDFAEGSIIIDDIRKLYEQTRVKHIKPQVYVLDTGLKSMTHAAQNAFLKLLEEPRPGLHFILATHQYDKLLPTIISRTQQIEIHPVERAVFDVFLRKLVPADDERFARLQFMAQGKPALLQRMLADGRLYDKRVQIMTDAKSMMLDDKFAMLEVAHRYKDNRTDSVQLLGDACLMIRQHLVRQPNANMATKLGHLLHALEQVDRGGNIRLQIANAILR